MASGSVAFQLTATVGLLLSFYALYVEIKASDPVSGRAYRAMCDLAESVSCTKVLTSRWSKGLGLIPQDSPLNLPNPIYGIAHYLGLILVRNLSDRAVSGPKAKLRVTPYDLIAAAMSSVSLGVSVYLAYILIVHLKDFCVVCVATYVCNAIITAISVQTIWTRSRADNSALPGPRVKDVGLRPRKPKTN